MSGEQANYESPPNGAYFDSYYDDAPFYLIPRDSPPDIYTDHQEVEMLNLTDVHNVCTQMVQARPFIFSWHLCMIFKYFRMLWPP